MGRCQLDGVWLIYLVMECADEDLGQVLPRRPLSPAEAREVLNPALEALAFLHTRGFALTSLRPANILAVGDQLRLASEHIRRAGEVWERGLDLGPYDAPELPRSGITPAADVWSLGVTLVEALTQHRPKWDLLSSADPLLPPGIPEPFAEIVRHALQRDPAWRWNVPQIQARLLETAAAPAAAAEPAPAGKRRRYGRLAVLILVALAAIVVGLWLFGPPPAKAPSPAPNAVGEAPPQPAPQAAAQPEQAAPVESAAAPETSSAPAAAPAAPRAAEAAPEPTAALESRSTAGAAPGAIVEQVLPDVLPKARESIQGSVKVGVKVRVDPSGKVVDAQLAPAGPSQYFAKAALAAARRWKFRPAGEGDQGAAREWLLRFQFERSGTKVNPEPLSR
jgi:TonB family protein